MRQAAHGGEHGPERYANAQTDCTYNQRPVVNHGFQGPLVGQTQITGAPWQ